ncbi:hypothetical protein GCM10028805_03260 [Spirosoma harenae]
MRTFFYFVSLVVASTSAFAQAQSEYMNQSTRERINFTELNSVNNATLFTIKGEPGKLIGTPYLDTTWQAGNVKFYNRVGVSLTADSLAGVPVRLDLFANEVEIRSGNKQVKAVKSTAVRYVDMNNSMGSVSRFVNVREYKGEAEGLTGFFDQLITGELDLLHYTSTYIRKANFNVAMNTGTKDDEIMQKSDWYVAQDKKAIKFSSSKKSILELMANKKDQIEAFLKSQKPDLKSRAGLSAVFTYYNKLQGMN